MKQLIAVRDSMLKGLTSKKMRIAVESMGKNPKRPLGKLNPWTWWPELVRGCNLSCVFCPARLIKKDEWNYMSRETWDALIEVVAELTPYGRINFAMLGEPTLHPEIFDFVRLARKKAPHVQITTYTNGVKLLNGEVTYKQLFESGINCVFTDMYAAYDTHKKLAEESGYEWYHEAEKPDEIVNVFDYVDDPNRHTIRLSENPYNWSKKKMGRGEFHTFLNTLDWKAAKLFDITPVTDPPRRRCDQPSKMVNLNYDGSFQVCCAAAMSKKWTTELGNISGGVEAFLTYWLGPYMQDVRMKVDHKDRAAHELCKDCSYVTIRSDIPYWKGGEEQAWDGKKWVKVPKYVPSKHAAGALKHMRRTPSSRERAIDDAKPKLF